MNILCFQKPREIKAAQPSAAEVAAAAVAAAAAQVESEKADAIRKSKKAQKWALYQERKSWGRACSEEETAADCYSIYD